MRYRAEYTRLKEFVNLAEFYRTFIILVKVDECSWAFFVNSESKRATIIYINSGNQEMVQIDKKQCD